MENNWKQKSLTPQLISKDSPSYNTVNDLQNALSDGNIRNIAITGPYGSGKSSVLATLMDSAPEGKKFLDISLATLDADESLNENQENDGNGGSSSKNNHEILNRKIEYSILQQLVYRETLDKLPFSRLKKIRHLSSHTIKVISCYLIGFAIAFCLSFKLDLADRLYELINFPDNLQNAISLLAIVFLIVMSYEIISKIIRTFGGLRLQHVNVGGNEINMNDEGSIFNRYLDEILYFFQCTDYNVVIIEDLDRFNTTDIFLKLRELNHLINKSKIVGRNIQFIYAVKDDMFKDSSRSKFFDYITTVIPVITTNNSKDKLREALSDLGHAGEISDDDIRDIAFHIDDMRLLYNIANEYHQYNSRLNTDENHKLEARKMLAMIAVKNYHPHDFSLLHKRQGKIYNAISPEMKKQYVDFAIKTRIEKRENIAQNNIEIYKRSCHLTEKELRLIYVEAIARSFTSATITAIEVDGSYRSFLEIAESEELFDKLISMRTVYYRYEYSSSRLSTTSCSLDFAAVEKTVDAEFPYKARIETLQEGIDKYEQELSDINMEKLRVSSYLVKELLVKFNIYKEEFFKNIGLSDMEEDFIRMGLIAEDYNDYISYFYPGIMSLADHHLCLDIRLNRPTNVNEHIDSPENILRELPKGAMRNESVNIVELVDYLVQNNILWSQYYSLYIDTLIEKHPTSFLAYYCTYSNYAEDLYLECMKRKPQIMWRNIGFGTEEEQKVLYKYWFVCCENKNIVKAQIIWCNRHYDFLASIYDDLKEPTKMHLTSSFIYEGLTKTSKEMLQAVVDNNCYVLDEKNISIVVDVKQAKEDITRLQDLAESQMALSNNLISYTWVNSLAYFEMIDLTIDDYLRNFIHDGIIELEKDIDYKEEKFQPLFRSLLSDKLINDLTYQRLCSINTHNIAFTSDTYNLPEQKLKAFVNANTDEFSINIVQQLCNINSNIACDYIVVHKEHLTEILESLILDTAVSQDLMFRNEFNEIQLREIFKNMHSRSVVIDTKLATKICKLQSLKYTECDEDIMRECISHCSEESSAVYSALKHMQLNNNEPSVIDTDLKSIGSPYDSISETGKRGIKLQKAPWTISLAKHLYECGYISSFTEEGNIIKVNTKRNR